MRPLHTTHIDNLHIVLTRQHYAKSGEGSSFVHFAKSPTEIAGSVEVRPADICYTAKLKSSCYIYPGKPGNLWFPQACLDLIIAARVVPICPLELNGLSPNVYIQARQTIVCTKCPYICIYIYVCVCDQTDRSFHPRPHCMYVCLYACLMYV